MPSIEVPSPFGPLAVTASGDAIVSVDWAAVARPEPTPLLISAAAQLTAYFEGRLRAFNVPVAPHGTPFMTKIWRRIAAVPYAETVTYGALARAAMSSPRAVGMACGRNPIPIIIPCHRIVGTGGAMGGYSGHGGLDTKRHLLDFERRHRAG